MIEWRMKMEWIGSWIGSWYIILSRQKVAKTAGRRKGTKETAKMEKAGGARPCIPGRTIVRPTTMGRAPHHGPPVVATIPPGLAASWTMRFVLFWTSVWAFDLHVLGLLCSFVWFTWPSTSINLDSNHTFLLKT